MTAASPLRGAALLLTAVLLFACVDTMFKFLTARFNVPTIVAARFIVNLLLMVILLAPTQGAQLVRTNRTALVLVRALCLAGASIFIGSALKRMPVAETTAINFLAPVLVVVAARPLLREEIGWVGWTATLLGFAGVLLIVRPGSGLDAAGVTFALCGVVLSVLYQLLSRVLAATERTMALLFYTALAGSIMYGTALAWLGEEHSPTALEVLLLTSIGVFGGVGHFLYTAAFRYAPASLLAPMNYIQLLWAALLGWAVFGDVPDGVSLLGMAAIAASGAAVALKNRASRGRGDGSALAPAAAD